MLASFLGYRCSLCGREHPPAETTYTCPHDGGNLDALLDLDAVRHALTPQTLTASSQPSLWRYLPLIPVVTPLPDQTPLHAAGWTPIYQPESLARSLGLSSLWIKDEGRNPTASFKDRASAVVVARALEIGSSRVVTASTGNAGAALAGMAAAVGLPATIFAPRNAPPAKVAQLLVYGAQVILVDGSYDDAFDLSIQASNEFGWYCRNTGYNPLTLEGKKTAAFEIWEQLLTNGVHHNAHDSPSSSTSGKVPSFGGRGDGGEGSRPLNVFVSVGDGNIISGIHKGFKELHDLGWLETMPRLFGVQASGSAAVANAFYAGSETITPVHADTLADSISVDLPRDGVRAVRAARETGGGYMVVEDAEILQAIAELGKAGIFAEPAGAAAYAGLKTALRHNLIQPDEPTLVLITGSGLKDVRAAMQAVPDAPVIEPTLAAVKRLLST